MCSFQNLALSKYINWIKKMLNNTPGLKNLHFKSAVHPEDEIPQKQALCFSGRKMFFTNDRNGVMLPRVGHPPLKRALGCCLSEDLSKWLRLTIRLSAECQWSLHTVEQKKQVVRLCGGASWLTVVWLVRESAEYSSKKSSKQIRAERDEGMHLETTLRAEKLALRRLKPSSHLRSQADLLPVDSFLAQNFWHSQLHWTAIKRSISCLEEPDRWLYCVHCGLLQHFWQNQKKKNFDQIVFSIVGPHLFSWVHHYWETDWEGGWGRVIRQKEFLFSTLLLLSYNLLKVLLFELTYW